MNGRLTRELQNFQMSATFRVPMGDLSLVIRSRASSTEHLFGIRLSPTRHCQKGIKLQNPIEAKQEPQWLESELAELRPSIS